MLKLILLNAIIFLANLETIKAKKKNQGWPIGWVPVLQMFKFVTVMWIRIPTDPPYGRPHP